MVDEKTEQEIRICGAPGCDNPIGDDRRRRCCSQDCLEAMQRLQYQQKLLREVEKRRAGNVCAIEGCDNLVQPPRRRHCSDVCAAKTQKEQVRRGSEVNRKKRRSSSKTKQERQVQEIRAIRTMQNVPAERWQEYEFRK